MRKFQTCICIMYQYVNIFFILSDIDMCSKNSNKSSEIPPRWGMENVLFFYSCGYYNYIEEF